MSYAPAQNALDKCKIQMMAMPDTVFFTSVCLSLKHTWNTEIPTAATNGLEIRYNPDFFLSLTESERLFLMLHETLHVALLHTVRIQEKDAVRWNMAGDYVINALLKERGFHMPSGGLYDSRYHRLSTEQVYNLLPTVPPSNFICDVIPSDAAKEKDAIELDNILVRAKIQSDLAGERAGTLPMEIHRHLSQLLFPAIPWKRLLARYMNQLLKTDYTYKKPNRRYFPEHILPTPYAHGLEHIAIAIDTSGSITQKKFDQFLSEIQSIIKHFKPQELTVLQFDCRLKTIDSVKSLKDLDEIKMVGGGGTNVAPVLAWASHKKPKLLVILTDGEFSKNLPNQYKNVLWVIHSNKPFAAPFGRKVKFPL